MNQAITLYIARSKIAVTVLCLAFISCPAWSQNNGSKALQNSNLIERLHIYIDCGDCDFNYMLNEIRFVNFVRDPYLAHVHILITYQKTASEGRKYSLRFLGRDIFTGMDQSLTFISLQSDTEAIIRKGLVRILKMGIMPYVSQTEAGAWLDIEYDDSHAASRRNNESDHWQFWVFHIDLQGGLEAEESQSELEIVTSVNADRITEAWKVKTELLYEHQQKSFKDDDEKILGKRKEWQGQAELIKSLNARWSTGLFGTYQSSTYKNINTHYGIATGIEYNFFPWIESDRRIFSISYSAGVRFYDYRERTLYDKEHETLTYGKIRMELGFIQYWGDIDASIENSHYFYDLNKNLLTLDAALSLRISKGLAFKISLEAESVHDQLYLPKGNATREEILLRQKKLATTYDVSFSVGLRYSFGSIYNNIVNKRF